jgi:hypothetical protein
MQKYLSIIAYDLRNTRRDPTLLLIFWVPFLILAVVRFGIPILVSYLPVVSNYYLIIIAFFALLNAVFPGFILSFILLDEKDMNLFPVIQVTPVSLSGFLIARILFMIIFGFLGSLLLIIFNGIVWIPYTQAMALALLCALNVPILILLISTLAKNKIEGLTLLKAATITLVIPSTVLFIDTTFENLLAIFPAFWVYRFIDGASHQMLFFFAGLLILSFLNVLCFRFAIRNIHSL